MNVDGFVDRALKNRKMMFIVIVMVSINIIGPTYPLHKRSSKITLTQLIWGVG
jgi:hypothetical protein